MENKLDQYLRETKTTALYLSRQIGVSAPYICDLRYGRRKPSAAVAKAIERVTGGFVARDTWVSA